MVKVSEIYKGSEGGRFLNTTICDEKELWQTTLTVKAVELREINDREKLVVHFEEMDDVLVLNKTNALILADAWGEEAELWEGKQLMLRKVKRQFRGKPIDAIEVEPCQEDVLDMSKSKKKRKK